MQPYTQSTVNPVLSSMAQMYFLDQQNQFLGLKLAPPLMVPDLSATYGKLEKTQILQTGDWTKGAIGAAARRIDQAFTSDSYKCEMYFLEGSTYDANKLLCEKMGGNAAASMTGTLTYALLYDLETRIKTLLQNESTFSSTYQYDVTNEWDDVTNATPGKDIRSALMKLKRNLGGDKPAGTRIVLGMADTVFVNLCNTAEIRGNKLYSSGISGVMDTSELARMLGVDEIATTWTQSGSSDLWSDEYAYLAVVSDSIDLAIPRVANTFIWSGGSPSLLYMDSYRDEVHLADIIRGRMWTDEKVLNTSAMILMRNVSTNT